MKHWKFFAIISVALLLIVRSNAQTPSFDTSGLTPLSREELPEFGTYWIKRADGFTAPMPCPPRNYAPVYVVDDNTFVVDETQVLLEFQGESVLMSASLFPEDEEDPGDPLPLAIQDTRRNYEKFAGQLFALVDTNNAAINDTNLYNACLAFPDDGSTNAILQIQPFGSLGVLIKASHFDYSTETRDFALLVCDDVAKPTWKIIDLLGASDAQDGWLVQGLVPRTAVADTMFIMVTNVTRDCNAFFQAVPYSGPEVQLGGVSPNDVVTGEILLYPTVIDLSGVTNVKFSLDVDGVQARYSFSASNSIGLDTRYNFGGWANVNFEAMSKSTVYEPLNSPVDNAKLSFSGATTLPLYFDNSVFLAYASDEASPELGQNDIDFYANVPVDFTASITEPESGRILKTFSGTASPGYIYLLWNFTEQDGFTPYTNDSYTISFESTASGEGGTFAMAAEAEGTGSSSMILTNKIGDVGRKGAGAFLTYQEEDPGDTTGNYWNTKADMWIRQTLRLLYTDQYKSLSLTQYTTDQVGTNRNHANCVPLSGFTPTWADFMPINLTNKNYSDLTIGGAHCDGFTIGYSKAYLNNKFSTDDLIRWLGGKPAGAHSGKNWRLRKTAIWGCWSGAETGDLTFPQACGIRRTIQQMTSYCTKNAGFFFGGPVPQVWSTGGLTITTAQAAAFLDQAFIAGKNPYPGACDPTYSIRWAIQATVNQYPEMNIDPKTGLAGAAQPVLYGCPKLIDTTVYDNEITGLDFTHVKEN